MVFEEIERRLLKALADGEDRIPRDQLEDMRDLVRHSEPGIALENFCTQLYEYDVAVAPSLKKELATLGRAMKVDPHYWEDLALAD